MIENGIEKTSGFKKLDNLIMVCGNIGAGKTTLLDTISNLVPDLNRIIEGVEIWGNKDRLLEKFYIDSKKHAYSLQLAIQDYQRTRLLEVHNSDTDYIMERGPLDSLFVFTQKLHDDGMITDEQAISLWTISEEMKCIPSEIIYVHCDVETCLENIKKRSREGETALEEEYLIGLEKYYIILMEKLIETGVKIYIYSYRKGMYEIPAEVSFRKMLTNIDSMKIGSNSSPVEWVENRFKKK